MTKVKSTFDYPSNCRLTENHQFECLSRDIVRRHMTSPGYSGFGGVRIRAAKGFFVRPEFEFSVAGDYIVRMTARVSAGVGW